LSWADALGATSDTAIARTRQGPMTVRTMKPTQLTSLTSERRGRLARPGLVSTALTARDRCSRLGSTEPAVADRIALVHGYEGEVGSAFPTPRV